MESDYLQELVVDSRSLTVLIHGFEGSRLDWQERGGYTKGGDLTDRLSQLGRPWTACDLYGHGDWTADEPGFSPEHISDELFPAFIARSADAILGMIEVTAPQVGAEQVDVVSYSAGCHVAVEVLKRPGPLPVRSLLLAAPTPEKAYDDEYSLHNNLDVFVGRSVGVFCGRRDEEVPFDEATWFFDQIPGTSKQRWDYDAGHSLPVAWVDDAITLLAQTEQRGLPDS